MPLPLLIRRAPDIASMVEAKDTRGLIRLLTHPDIDTQWMAAAALGTLGRPAVGDLLRGLDHHDARVRLGIIEAIGEIGDPLAVPPLQGILAGDTSGEIRWAAALALGNLGGTGTIPSLVKALGDPDKYVRFGAALALEKLTWEPGTDEERALSLIARQEWPSLLPLGSQAVGPLLRATRDQDPAIRARAVEILGEIGGPGAGEACDPDSQGPGWRGPLEGDPRIPEVRYPPDAPPHGPCPAAQTGEEPGGRCLPEPPLPRPRIQLPGQMVRVPPLPAEPDRNRPRIPHLGPAPPLRCLIHPLSAHRRADLVPGTGNAGTGAGMREVHS